LYKYIFVYFFRCSSFNQ